MLRMAATVLLSNLVDSVGRKPMSFIGLGLMMTSLVGLSLSYVLPQGAWLAIGLCFLFRVAFSMSLGPLPYIIAAEVFPTALQAPGVSFCLAVKWMANFTVAFSWPLLCEVVGLAGRGSTSK